MNRLPELIILEALLGQLERRLANEKFDCLLDTLQVGARLHRINIAYLALAETHFIFDDEDLGKPV